MDTSPLNGATTLPALGLTATPFPSMPDAKVWSFTELSGTDSPSSGLYTVFGSAEETFADSAVADEATVPDETVVA